MHINNHYDDIIIIDIWDMPTPFGKELNVGKFSIG
jgi:hypothetical protein